MPESIKMLKQILEASPILNWAFWSIVKDRTRIMRKGQAIKDTAIELANFMRAG